MPALCCGRCWDSSSSGLGSTIQVDKTVAVLSPGSDETADLPPFCDKDETLCYQVNPSVSASHLTTTDQSDDVKADGSPLPIQHPH